MNRYTAILIVIVLLTGSSLFGSTEGLWRFCPLPIAETEGILSRWLRDSGFIVRRAPAEGGRIRLTGTRGNESWQLILEPHSPLGSRILAEYAVDGHSARRKVEEMWAYLENYTTGAFSEARGPDQEIPVKVLSRKGSVVCIRANTGNDLIQFTGFIIDRKGLVLSTAHDLSDIQKVMVTLDNGQEVEGHLARIDSLRDLALIDIRLSSSTFVMVEEGRHSIGPGEKVFSIGCSTSHAGRFHSGMIVGPPMRVNNLPLLQVGMETLPGSSGSPVFDGSGYFIGLIKGRFRGTDSVGFLIPMRTVIEFVEKQ